MGEKGAIYSTEEELIEKAKKLKGKKFKDIDKTGRIANQKAKGRLGQIIEESHFGYEINSRAEADFKELNVELKVTPYKLNKNGTVSAKERLVLNIIDYMTEVDKGFYTSSFWLKNNKLLLVFYRYEEGLDVGDYRVTDTLIFEVPEEDLPTVRQDWEFIVEKIKQGKAHELSEGDTFYLGACPKGKDSSSVRPQPYSDIPAMQRAYAFKQSYMTHILRTRVLGQSTEKLIKDERTSIQRYVDKKLSPIIGRTLNELCEEYGQVDSAKNVVQLLMSKVFGIKGTDLSKIEEFEKANIKIKTIRVENDNKIRESMSFPTFKFKEIVETPWEESDLKNILGEQKYLFLVFKKDENDELVFKGYRFWNMPYQDLLEVKKVYERTVDILKEGVRIEEQVTKKGIIRKNNLPSMKDNPVCHVRPHGANAADVYELPDGRLMTKQCFWLNNGYVLNQIKNLID
ncbi:restriction endonuclease [Clostridium swellfunianum]|uniref:Sau3AI family type II restriction endonuclease n=1 Tax=Clostridium swellfunianum TaxID=1367462 RepID=UPI00202F8B1F|nr:Sau3AI family type II restriction endonuclease [Clostridium swellfunianum]MCM0647243.1 restriction endonuclease [Clostridium swellfunianum]